MGSNYPSHWSDAAHIPRSAEEAVAVAAAQGFAIPAPCLPGVVANLALLARHAATLLAEPPE